MIVRYTLFFGGLVIADHPSESGSQESSYSALRHHEHLELDRRGAAERLHQRVA